MGHRAAILCLAILLGSVASHAEGRGLTFLKAIGGGWAGDKAGWMSFVAFSPDGRAIASDAAADPDDVSGNLTLWSFPGGRLIRRLAVRPQAISADWKYYASDNSVGDLRTGEVIFSSPPGVNSLHAFSSDGR